MQIENPLHIENKTGSNKITTPESAGGGDFIHNIFQIFSIVLKSRFSGCRNLANSLWHLPIERFLNGNIAGIIQFGKMS